MAQPKPIGNEQGAENEKETCDNRNYRDLNTIESIEDFHACYSAQRSGSGAPGRLRTNGKCDVIPTLSWSQLVRKAAHILKTQSDQYRGDDGGFERRQIGQKPNKPRQKMRQSSCTIR